MIHCFRFVAIFSLLFLADSHMLPVITAMPLISPLRLIISLTLIALPQQLFFCASEPLCAAAAAIALFQR